MQDQGWPVADAPGFLAAWQAATAGDARLRHAARHAAVRFRFESGGGVADFAFDAPPGEPAFTLAAPAAAWAKALQAVPPRHHHSLFAMRMRVPGFALRGAELAFVQHCHLARRVLEIGRWVAAGHGTPVPDSLRPALAEPEPAGITGRYLPVVADGTAYRIHAEQAGEGLDLLCLHTAGADGRQFHRLMADRGITDQWRLTAFDLPWHGKSPPPPGALPGDWALTTDRYVQLVMGVIAAAGLRRPVVLGASMSGEICLELALRHPEAFRGIVACEASDHVEGRKTPWADHPQVNQAIFVPEWIEGLMAPQSPAACAADVWWGYSQGGQATFARDIDFYSGEWDARDRVHRIDTARCPLFMLTGEYDYSCTAEHSAATAARIPGAHFAMMPGIGHFPFAENPPLFAQHLRPILDSLRARP
ncbi:alpha/beta fold hydrolase [Dankookia sp. GCM10030260]|uniref:alpha/beta fold hydrolase n=1 Tax=Dankookia sp. GCM10030260 TaxID=3273390 RepID=UPI003621CA1C